MTRPIDLASIHRFHDVLYLAGHDPESGRWNVMYLEPAHALSIAETLIRGALDCQYNDFRESDFGTHEKKKRETPFHGALEGVTKAVDSMNVDDGTSPLKTVTLSLTPAQARALDLVIENSAADPECLDALFTADARGRNVVTRALSKWDKAVMPAYQERTA